MRKRLRAQEEEEKKQRARRGDRNHILHYDTADESRARGLPQPPIAPLRADQFVMSFGISVLKGTAPAVASSSNPLFRRERTRRVPRSR